MLVHAQRRLAHFGALLFNLKVSTFRVFIQQLVHLLEGGHALRAPFTKLIVDSGRLVLLLLNQLVDGHLILRVLKRLFLHFHSVHMFI